VVPYRTDAAYAAKVQAAGNQRLLAQVLTDENEHSRLRDATYLSVLRSLEAWLDSGVRPDAARIQTTCLSLAAASADCRFSSP
jgi:hypothetical protein